MSWLVQWTVPAERMLHRIYWRDAARVDAAVMRVAPKKQPACKQVSDDTQRAATK